MKETKLVIYEESEELQKLLKEQDATCRVGDIFTTRHTWSGKYVRIIGFSIDHWANGTDHVIVHTEGSNDGKEWKKDSSTHDLHYFAKGNSDYHKLSSSIEEAEAQAIRVITGEETFDDINVEEQVQSTAIVTTVKSGKDVELLASELVSKKEHMQALAQIIENKMAVMRNKAYKMGEQAQYMMRIVKMFERYLGYYEEITQIATGELASKDSPIVIRQLKLWMDEEVGDVEYRDGQIGIDFKRVEDFDKWIAQEKNYKIVVPEEKCIVVLGISRQDRNYSENILEQFYKSQANYDTYLLIRNGENLWRIWGDLKFKDFLFPSATEYQKIVEEMEKYGEEPPMHVLGKEMDWREQALFLQGLLDRTEILRPYKIDAVNIFLSETFESGAVSMIRDGEQINLPDGRSSYKEWKLNINDKIDVGSRIVISQYRRSYGDGREYDYSYFDGRYGRYSNNLPDFPAAGVYKVVDAKETENRYISSDSRSKHITKKIKFLYSPGDEIWVRDEWDRRERKNRVSFHIDTFDDEVLNYDEISLEDVQYYISNRIERSNYLNMLPVLYNLRDIRRSEIEQEKHFVKLITNELGCEEKLAWECVEWWKLKNIWKRPLSEDDAKAWRMIKKEIKKRMK